MSDVITYSEQSENVEYSDAFVQKLADFFAENYPDLKGYSLCKQGR